MSCPYFINYANINCAKQSLYNYKYKNNDDCNIDTTYFTSVYNDDPYIKDINGDVSNINMKLDDNKDAPYSFCKRREGTNNVYINCALMTNSPWFTLSKTTNKCIPPVNLSLPDGFTINKLNVIETPKIYEFAFSKNNAYCDERWYDWFLIENYHFGNGYYKDGDKIKVFNCFKPCTHNNIPFKSDNIYNYCISKKYAYNGLFNNTLGYTPLALIALLSFNYYDASIFFLNEYQQIYINTSNENKYDIQSTKDIYYSDEVIKYNTDCNIININQFWNGQSKQFKNNLFFFKIHDELKQLIKNNIYDILLKNYDDPSSSQLTYKSSIFSIPNIDIMQKMHEYNLFNPNKLIICYNIAKRLYDNRQLTYYGATFFDSTNNYDTPLEDLTNSSFNTLKIEYIIIFLIRNSKDDNLMFNKNILGNKNKIIRLTNIFKKASNHCFDGKSNFSKVIFDILKKKYPTDATITPFSYNENEFFIEYPDDTITTNTTSNPNNTINIKNDVNNKPFADYTLPNVTKTINNFIYILFICFFIYLGYIIYQIFGDIILQVLNVAYIYLRYIWFNIRYMFSDKETYELNLVKSNYNNISKLNTKVASKIAGLKPKI